MTQNNIDTQFANARAEIRSLMKYVNPTTTHGGHTSEVLQSIVDTLDAIQDDSFGEYSASFYRLPPVEDSPVYPNDEPTNPNFQAFKGLESEDDPISTFGDLEHMSQTDRLC